MNLFDNEQQFLEQFKQRLRTQFATDIESASEREHYQALAQMVFERISEDWLEQSDGEQKELHYFSMEFLLGRLITNHLYHLGIRDTVERAFDSIGLDLDAIEHQEVDAGLGNGGLGRLAACFLDSIASLGYKGHAFGIRYRYGFFEQTLRHGYQREVPDDWLKNPYPWEVRREEEAIDIPFGGTVSFEAGDAHYTPEETIRAVPYDMPIPGEANGVVNTLRLWNAEPTDYYPDDIHPFDYNEEIRQISGFLYPDDTTREGKILRIKQQYFFSAAGVRDITRNHYERHGTFENFSDYHVFQINDTHPALIIPELMRVLLDDYGLEWDEAWSITQSTCAYTNHTILAEALEKWPVSLLQPTIPRVYQIIEEINKRFCGELLDTHGKSEEAIGELAIIAAGEVRMAHLAIVGSFSVNGVAELHTKILTTIEMKKFHALYPDKFNSKTNGITHRRFLKHINPDLAALISEHAPEWEQTLSLEPLLDAADDSDVQDRFLAIKREKKQALADHIEREQGVRLDVDSVFDVQVKRMHEYKRQLMNALHIMMLHHRLKTDVAFRNRFVPRSFIFGAKAAASYHFAKKVIKLINTIGDIVNNDPDTKDFLKVVFVENYNVTYAERIMPACDVSEQISTATKEASGTGNMKFMMNGSITLGTLDGANVEIAERVGEDHIEIFGMNSDEVTALYEAGTYDPGEIYENDPEIRQVVDQLTDGFFAHVRRDEFAEIKDNLLNEDRFFVLKDLRAYSDAQERLNERFKDKRGFAKTCLVNIAKSGYFSSDRTIENYVDDIWKLKRTT